MTKRPMATIYKQFKINTPVEQLWQKMSDLSTVHTLFAMLENTELAGDKWVCRTQDGGELKDLSGYTDLKPDSLKDKVEQVIDSEQENIIQGFASQRVDQ